MSELLTCVQWNKARLRLKVLTVVSAFLLLFPFGMIHLGTAGVRASHPGFLPMKETCLFLQRRRKANPESQLHNNGLLTKWDYGHWAHYYCGLPTVTSPMTASQEAAKWNLNAMGLFYEPIDSTLRKHLEAYKIGYILAILPSPNFQVLATHMPLTKTYIEPRHGQLYFTTAFFQTLNARLFFDSPDHLPQWLGVIYRSPTTVTIDGRNIPMMVLAEVRRQVDTSDGLAAPRGQPSIILK